MTRFNTVDFLSAEPNGPAFNALLSVSQSVQNIPTPNNRQAIEIMEVRSIFTKILFYLFVFSGFISFSFILFNNLLIGVVLLFSLQFV